MPPVCLYGAFMISLYFGLPGCGKTTLLSKFALTPSPKSLNKLREYIKHPYDKQDYNSAGNIIYILLVAGVI